MLMDAALSEERENIAPRVRQMLQQIVDRYALGADVVAVQLQQGGVRPPEQVQAAFDDVLRAGQEGERAKNEAQAYANDVVPRAQGAAARLREEAQGYKATIVAQAQGDADRFKLLLAEYQRSPQVTRDRLYVDAMQQIYGNVTKILVDARSGNNMLFLPLDRIIQQVAQGGVAADPGAALQQPPAANSVPPLAGDARTRDNARSRERETR
jgi:membrane protease subunit HflK